MTKQPETVKGSISMTEDPWARWPYIAFEVQQKFVDAWGEELSARCTGQRWSQLQMAIFMSASASAAMHVAAEICIEDGIPEELFHDLARGAWRDAWRDRQARANESLN
jgi:hypothetical protein